MERRSSLAGSQKDENGKWKVDMRYVANYTEDVNIMRKEKNKTEKKVIFKTKAVKKLKHVCFSSCDRFVPAFLFFKIWSRI